MWEISSNLPKTWRRNATKTGPDIRKLMKSESQPIQASTLCRESVSFWKDRVALMLDTLIISTLKEVEWRLKMLFSMTGIVEIVVELHMFCSEAYSRIIAKLGIYRYCN